MSLNLARKYIYKKKKFIVRTKQTVLLLRQPSYYEVVQCL